MQEVGHFKGQVHLSQCRLFKWNQGLEHSFHWVEHYKGQEVVGRYKDQVEVDHCKGWLDISKTKCT